MRALCLTFLCATVTATSAAAQQASPVLHYTPPPNAYRSASTPPDDYSFNGFNASVQLYPFRPFNGDIVQAFRATLLRDWITPLHQEQNIGTQPTFQTTMLPGADMVMTVRFAENIVGLLRPHMRMLIVSRGAAAIVDASAGTVQSWQQAVPLLNAMSDTFRIESERPAAPLTPVAGGAVAGLYMGLKQKYTATLANVVGGAYYTTAAHYYLFSADGRVYCAYDNLDLPGGRIDAFDFDAAERRDPVNSGHYTIDGGWLIIRMNGEGQPIVTAPPKDGRVTINTVMYTRQ
jgi:hypothetical protein